MAYNISKHGTINVKTGGAFDINDDGLNTTDTSLALVGKYYVGYGETIAQNSVNLLENFASDDTVEGPANPIEGQLWWKPSDEILYVRHDGAWLTLDPSTGLVAVKDSAWTELVPVFRNVLVQRANSTPVSLASSEDTDWQIHYSDPLHKWFRNDGLGTVSTDATNVATIKAGINLVTVASKNMQFHGTATSAKYADVAELYTSDENYEPGTLMMVKDTLDTEVTQTVHEKDPSVFGVVTTDPALLMNSKLQGVVVGVALLGRVPCKVTGPIKRGDRIISSNVPGHGQSEHNVDELNWRHVVGRALDSKPGNNTGIIEVIVGVK